MSRSKENKEQRHAFECYLKLGAGRSISRLHTQLVDELGDRARCERTLENWSSSLGWRARVREFERAEAEVDRERLATEYRAMQERHAKEGRFAQGRAIEALRARQPAELTASEAIRLLDVGIKIEASARPKPPAKIDRTEALREMAIEEGLDPDEVLDAAEKVARISERQQREAS